MSKTVKDKEIKEKRNIDRAEFKGDYDHLNIDGRTVFTIDVDSIADQIVASNFGTIRFLAAIVRARRRSKKSVDCFLDASGKDVLADRLEAMMEEGIT